MLSIISTRLTLPKTPTRAGYSLVGWFSSGGDQKLLHDHFTESTTLYAHWEREILPVCQSGRVEAPSEFVRGQSYDVSFIHTFDRTVDEESASRATAMSIDSDPREGSTATDVREYYNDKESVKEKRITVHSDSTRLPIPIQLPPTSMLRVMHSH